MKKIFAGALALLLFNHIALCTVGTKAAQAAAPGTPALINVDFGAGLAASAKAGMAATGQSAGDFWNWYTRDGGGGSYLKLGTIPNLLSASKVPTGALLTAVNLPGAWGNGSTDPMYLDYLYPFSGNASVVLSNLPPGNYDLFIYGHDGNYELQSSTVNHGVRACYDQPLSTPLAWTEGVQFVTFRNIQVPAAEVLTLTIRNGKRGYAVISGMQIAPADTITGIPPNIIVQPESRLVPLGSSVTFNVEAAGTEPLSFQWRKGGVTLPGETTASLTIAGAQSSNVGSYAVVVSNPTGQVISAPASLLVFQAVTNRIINIDFGSGMAASGKKGPAAVGVSASDFWNWYSRDNPDGSWMVDGSLPDLRYENGVASGASLMVQNAPGAWGNGSSDPMYADYIYPLQGETAVVTLTNLPPGRYDLYAYSQDGRYQVTAGGRDYGTKTNVDWPVANPPAWQTAKQYSLFSDIEVGASDPLKITVQKGKDGWAIISGLQLVQTRTTPTVDAPLINVDFGSGRTNSAKTGLAATGLSANDFWNWYTCEGPGGVRLKLGTIPNLRSAAGQLTGAHLTAVNLPGSWGIASPDPMYKDYIYPFSGLASVIISNLPSGTYDFFVYGYDGNYELQSSSTNYGNRTCLDHPLSAPLVWAEGTQFVAFRNVQALDGELLTLTIRNGQRGYAVISGMQISPASTTVTGTPPVITAQPLDKTITSGSAVSFSVSATGSQPLSYQWRYNGVSIPDATLRSLTLTNVLQSQAGAYSAEVQNPYGSAVSSDAILLVGLAPAITAQPVSQYVPLGSPVSFTVSAGGTEPLAFQWLRDGVNLAGATSTTLHIQSAQYSDAGYYSVIVSNLFGKTPSSPAGLTIVQLVTNPIINIDFGAGLNASSKTGPAAMGVGPSDFWNWYTRDNSDGSWKVDGSLPDLKFQDGSPSGATMTVQNAPGAWGNGSSDPMYVDYIYPLQGETAVVTVSNLPPGTYNLYVYSQDGRYQVEVGDADYGTRTNADLPFVNLPAWQDGKQYSLFPDVMVGTSKSLRLTVRKGQSGWAIISGLQLVQISTVAPNSAPVPVIEVSQLATFPGWTNLIVIAPDNFNASVIFDGSKSSDIDDTNFSYFWFEGTNLLATTAITTNQMAVGSHEVMLWLDDTHPYGTNSASVTVEVITPSQAITIMFSLLEESNLPPRSLRPLEASLGAADAAFELGRFQPGINQLTAFQNKVRAQIAPSNPVLADQLIRAAQSIIDAFGR